MLALPDLALEGGSIHALVGPSGIGKTTALYGIAGLVELASGKVLIDGRDFTDEPPERRRLPLVPQEVSLFPRSTLLENVAFGLRVRGVATEARREEATRWLERLRIGELAHRFPHEVSGGQAQRAAMARALVVDAPVVLLDEPWAHLDAESRDVCRRVLRETVEASGRAALVVSHDRRDIESLGANAIALG